MTDEQRQRLSALVDGEGSHLDRQLAITAAMDDHELAACWERYVSIGRLIRGESVSLAVRGLAPRVAALVAAPAITDRPPFAQPDSVVQPDVPRLAAATAVAGPLPVDNNRHRRRRPPLSRRPPMMTPGHRDQAARPLIGLALAAGVMLMAVVVGPRLLLETAPTLPALAGAIDAGAAGQSVLERWRVGTDGTATADLARLDDLLVNHRERAAVYGLTGFMPHATLVGFSGGR